MQYGMVAAAAAALVCAGQASAARYYEFQISSDTPIVLETPFPEYAPDQRYYQNRASVLTILFDTGGSRTPAGYDATGVGGLTSYLSPNELKSLNVGSGTRFDLTFDMGQIAVGPYLQPLAVTGFVGYNNCNNRYHLCQPAAAATFTVLARTSDTAPASLDEREDVLVTPAPEPATWAMMMLGVGAVGFAMRRGHVATRVSYSA